MTESEFSDSIQSALGRAFLYARTNDVEPFRNVILDACLHCYAVDPQSEGTRAPYMLELVKLTENPEFFYEEIVRSLESCGDDWDAVQRFRLALYLAMKGDEHARRAMYLNFKPGPRMVEQTAIDFVRMDGIDGLLFAADQEGALLRTNPTDVDEGYLFSYAVEHFGEERTLNALRCAAETNPNIAAYLSAAESHRRSLAADGSKSPGVRALTYAQLKPKLSELRSFWISKWGEHASLDDLHLAAADLLDAGSRDERLSYLRPQNIPPEPLVTFANG